MKSDTEAVEQTVHPAFSWPVRVYYEDTDLSGVVYHANYLRFLERARTEWLRSFAYSQDRLLQDFGMAFTLVNISVAFIKPARLDDLLEVKVQLDVLKRASFSLVQTIEKSSADGGTVLTSAAVRVACVDADTFKPRLLPEDIYTSIAGRYPAQAANRIERRKTIE
jgi:acyl-CoA thioester hydrolase